MVVKVNIADKGKTFRKELETADALHGKVIGDKVEGSMVDASLEGYDFEIMGGSDSSGFPLSKDVEGITLKRVLLTHGFGMRDSEKGMRRRMTVRGKIITENIAQINLRVLKHGKKHLAEIFPEQNTVKAEVKEEKKEVEVAA